MEINKLDIREIEKLNELQKYFYEHLRSFIQRLDVKYFDSSRTFLKIDKRKGRYCLELMLVSKEILEIDVNVYINCKEITFYLDGWHENIMHDGISVAEFYERFEKLLLFGLSKSCKIVVNKSNGKPYKWSLYALENEHWKFYSMTGLLLYNFFGKRTKEEKQSNIFNEAIYPKELFQPS